MFNTFLAPRGLCGLCPGDALDVTAGSKIKTPFRARLFARSFSLPRGDIFVAMRDNRSLKEHRKQSVDAQRVAADQATGSKNQQDGESITKTPQRLKLLPIGPLQLHASTAFNCQPLE